MRYDVRLLLPVCGPRRLGGSALQPRAVDTAMIDPLRKNRRMYVSKVLFEAVLSFVLGSMFVVSSTPKLRRPKSFLMTVLTYEVLPLRVSRVYASVVPPVELLLGVLL
jgi:hypothetical protein